MRTQPRLSVRGAVLAILVGIAITASGFVSDASARSYSHKGSGHAASHVGSRHAAHSATRTSRGSRGKWSRRGRRSPVEAEPATAAAAPAPAAPATLSGPAVVSVAVGGVTSTSARVASDLSAVLDNADLRVLPVLSRGSFDDLIALAAMDKADLGLLHSDAVAALSEAERAQMRSRLAYVARLYNEEMHVLASRDVKSLRDLAGKKVNVGPEGSANAQTAELVFERLGIAPRIVHLDQPTALRQLTAGDLSADVLVSGQPVKTLQDLTADGRFTLLGVPYEPELQDLYLPAKIEAGSYRSLLSPDANVETIAVPVVLATVDAPPDSIRAARVTRFAQALVARFDALRDPARHPKWREVNLAATIPAWTRFAGAQAAIDGTTARSVGWSSGAPLTGSFAPAGVTPGPTASDTLKQEEPR